MDLNELDIILELRKRLTSAEKLAEDLKCCGNCKHSYYEHSYYVCRQGNQKTSEDSYGNIEGIDVTDKCSDWDQEP